MHKFCYNYVKPKYNQKTKLCYMDTDSFIVQIKTKDVYEDIGKIVEKRFKLERLLPKVKNKKVNLSNE